MQKCPLKRRFALWVGVGFVHVKLLVRDQDVNMTNRIPPWLPIKCTILSTAINLTDI